MDNEFKKYIKKVQTVSMTSAEKTRIFNYLENLIKEDPDVLFSEPALISSPYHFHLKKTRVLVFAVIAIFLITASSSYAASDALPGDIFYPVKVNINEKVGAYVAEQSGKKASYEAALALRRLAEAEKLTSEGRLTADNAAQIEANFKVHASNVQIALNATSTDNLDNVADAAVNFETGLSAHQGVMARLAADNSIADSSILLTPIIEKISSEITKANSAQPNLAARFNSNISHADEGTIKDKLSRTRSSIVEAESYFNSSTVSATTGDAVKASLKEAKDLVGNANTNLDSKSYQNAYIQLNQARTIINQAKSVVQVEVGAQDIFKQIKRINSASSSSISDFNADASTSNQSDIKTATIVDASSSPSDLTLPKTDNSDKEPIRAINKDGNLQSGL